MIKYDRFWVTMKKRGISQYDLYEHYEVTRSLLDRLRKNKNIEILRHKAQINSDKAFALLKKVEEKR